MHHVYAIYSSSFNKIYIGYTIDIDNRMLWHNEKATKGFTVSFRPWEVIQTETFDTKKEALIREKQLKSSRGRDFIWKLVQEIKGS